MSKKDRSKRPDPVGDAIAKGLPPVKAGALEARAKEIAETSCLLGTCKHAEHQSGTTIQ